MHNLRDIIDVLIVGMALSVALYWVGFLWGRISTDIQDFKWWAKITLLQGVILSAALKIFKVF